MEKLTSDLMVLAGLGVNIIIDSRKKTTSELIHIVGTVGRKGGHVTIKQCNSKTTSDLIAICSVYPNNITLDFSE